jgi:hypothetical protein
VSAAIDHAADAGQVADLEIPYLVADGDDPADDLVARDRRIQRVLPLVARGVQVGVADAAEQDVDLDVFGTRARRSISKGASGLRGSWAA